MNESLAKPEDKSSRRVALQKLVVLPIGAAVAIIGGGSLAYFLTRPSFMNIKVQYVGMTDVIEESEETIKLQSPAKLSDLETILWRSHPALQTMVSMQVLINGTGAFGNPELKRSDEVVLIALMAGG